MEFLITNELAILRWVHILSMVYWLGGEWGVFQTSYHVTNRNLDLAERRRHMETAYRIDILARTGIVLLLPLGLWIERYLLVPREAWARLCYEGLFYTLLLVSIGLNCHGLFYKYTFTTGLPGFPALVSFDPGELLFGVVAGMPFDRIFWLFLAFGAGAMLAHVLWAAVRRARTGRSASPQDSSADD